MWVIDELMVLGSYVAESEVLVTLTLTLHTEHGLQQRHAAARTHSRLGAPPRSAPPLPTPPARPSCEHTRTAQSVALP